MENMGGIGNCKELNKKFNCIIYLHKEFYSLLSTSLSAKDDANTKSKPIVYVVGTQIRK